MTWKIRITSTARRLLGEIRDRRVRALIARRIEGLEHEPEKQGKALIAELAGYRSLRAAGQRYRILYRVERETVIVVVVALGIRKDGSKHDVYALARRLLRLRLLDPPGDD